MARVLAEQRLDPFQQRHGERAAHAAAVEREEPLRAGTKKMPVAGGLWRSCDSLVHGVKPHRRC